MLTQLWEAYNEARRGKRYTVDEHQFELNAMENILNLHESICQRRYHPSRGVAFIIFDPVIREIVAAPFRDRVVHHFLYAVCAEWWDRRLIADSYSCRKGKGTLYAQRRMQTHIRRAVNESPQHRAFMAKLDLQGYFMSLKHDRLYAKVLWGLEKQFWDEKRKDRENFIFCHPEDREQLYQLLCYLWEQVIFDEPMKNIRIRGSRSDWKQLPPTKSLFNQPPGQGIVIGNLTSQLLSNIYMDTFDRYVTYDLGYKHYGRYVDDFFVVVPIEQKARLLHDIAVMEDFLKHQMGLTLHPKKRYYQEVNKGTPFVGAVVYEKCKVPGQRVRRNYYKAVYDLATQGDGSVEQLLARMGCVKHLDSRKFLQKMFDDFGWDWTAY